MKIAKAQLEQFVKEALEEAFRGSPEEREMMDKMADRSKKEFTDYVTRGRYTMPDLKGDMGELEGMEGPFQFSSGAVLYYDPKEGKYYDRGSDRYLDNEEASNLRNSSGFLGSLMKATELRENKKMKITKAQLRKIIKEELDATVDEGHGGMMAPKDVFFQVIMPALESAGFMGLDAMKMAKAAVDAAFDMGAQMMGEQDEDQ
jgi:hypothetical protein